MTVLVDIGTLIERDPAICGNRLRLAGIRMTVSRIAALWKSCLDAEQIQGEFPHLRLEQIYAALTYYHANQAEIEQILAQDKDDYEQFHSEHLAETQP